jgi:glycosyltransferase involved in cell wall biosynthesis
MNKIFIEYIADRAEHIVCGNQYLAEYYSKFNDVTILPTAVDVNYFKPLEQKVINENDEVIIGWSGSSSGYMYLYLIESYLKVILNKYPNVRLKIISDLPPNFKSIPSNKVEYIQWTQFNEVRELQSIDIGLMPLSFNQWSLGKCSYKMLTYMSCSLPVVVSNVGMNSEVFHGDSAGYVVNNDESWVAALSSLIENKKLRVSKGTEGRSVIINNYSNKQVVPQYADLIKRILNCK